MTVAELIAELQALPDQDAEVLAYDGWDWVPPNLGAMPDARKVFLNVD